MVLEQPYPEGEEVDVNTKIVLKIGLKEVVNTVKLDLTEELKGIAVAESYKVVVTKADGTVMFNGDLPEGNVISFEDKGKGNVSYKVKINEGEASDYTWEFK